MVCACAAASLRKFWAKLGANASLKVDFASTATALLPVLLASLDDIFVATLLLVILCHVVSICRSGEFVKVTFTTNPLQITMLSVCWAFLLVAFRVV